MGLNGQSLTANVAGLSARLHRTAHILRPAWQKTHQELIKLVSEKKNEEIKLSEDLEELLKKMEDIKSEYNLYDTKIKASSEIIEYREKQQEELDFKIGEQEKRHSLRDKN